MWRWTHVQSILYCASTVIQKICFGIKKNLESTHMVFVWRARIPLGVKFQIPSAPCYSMKWACPSVTLGRSIMALGFILSSTTLYRRCRTRSFLYNLRCRECLPLNAIINRLDSDYWMLVHNQIFGRFALEFPCMASYPHRR